MKTKTKLSLKSLIKKGNFQYVNSDITPENFPAPKTLREDYKLYHFNEYISSEDAIKKMEKDGYSAANVYELLSWKEWNGTDWVVALGSVAQVRGSRIVAYLDWDDSSRELFLFGFDGVWNDRCRFLAVRNFDSKAVSPLPSEPLTLSEITINGERYKLTKI